MPCVGSSLTVSSENRFCSVSVLAKRWLVSRARMDGCRMSVLLNRSHVRRLLSRFPSSSTFSPARAALELFCCVAREKGHNRANPKPFAFSAFPSTFLAVIRRVISVTPYNPFTTDSWSSSVSGVFPLSFIFPFHYKSVCFFRLSPQFLLLFSIFCQSYFKQRPKFCVMVRQGK